MRVSTSVKSRLVDIGLFEKYKEIHFIAHSMGGLITKKLLIDFYHLGLKEIQRVKSVLLFATPSQGAPLSEIGSFLSFINRQATDLEPANFNSFLQSLESDWSHFLKSNHNRTKVYCAYEVLPTFGVLVVSRVYAATMCDEPPFPILANHIDIVKPRSPHDATYIWAKARILEKNLKDDIVESAGDFPKGESKTNVFDKPTPPSLDGNFIVDITNPTPQFPTGPIGNLAALKFNYTLKWVPSPVAEKYVLWIDHQSDGVIFKVYNSSEICKSESNFCEAPPIILSQGEGLWAVRAIKGDYNSSNWSRVSNLKNKIQRTETNIAPPSFSGKFMRNLISPDPITSNDALSVKNLDTYSIKFGWSHVPESDGYVVWIQNGKQEETLKFFKSSDICIAILGICETPQLELENRPWVWTVRVGSLDEKHSSNWGPLVKFGYDNSSS